MPFATVWMDLEAIMPSEVSHTEKDKYHMILLIHEILKARQNKNKPKMSSQRTKWWWFPEVGSEEGQKVKIFQL